MYGSSRLGTMDYLPGQYSISYERKVSNTELDTVMLSGHRPYYTFSGNQLATGGIGGCGQHSWMNLPHRGQHLIGQKQYELSNHLGNVQVTVSDLPFKKKVGNDWEYSTALKSVYDYYPFGMLMPGRTVVDTTKHCIDMTQIKRVWVPAVINMAQLPPYFQNISISGSGAYEYMMNNEQLYITLEDDNSMINVELNSGVTEGELVLDARAFEIGKEGVILRVQGLDSLGESIIFYQTNLARIEEQFVIPLSAGYSQYSFSLQGVLNIHVNGGVLHNGYWDEKEVLVRVCDESGDQYRFGFTKHEKLNEVSGVGNTVDMGDRWLDTRIGRTPKPDAKAEKYPSLSPYSYVSNNPIYFFDKDGKEIWITPRNGGAAVKYTPGMSYDGDDKFVGNVVASLNYIYNNGADINNTIQTASADEVITKISYTNRHKGGAQYVPRNKSIKWNDKDGMIGRGKKNSFFRSPALVLFHELGHRDRHKNANPNKEFDTKAYEKEYHSKPIKKDGYSFPNRGEQIVTEDYENKAAEKLNEKTDSNEGERKNYNEVRFKEMESSTSTTPTK